MPKTKSFYKFEAAGPNAYRQVALRNYALSYKNKPYMIKKGEKGGLFYLSKDPKVRQYQLRDLRLALNGKLAQKTWLDKNSSLKGNYRVPQSTLMINSQGNFKGNESAMLNNSVLANSKINSGKNNLIVLNYANLSHTNVKMPDAEEKQVLMVDTSNLNYVKLRPQMSSQILQNVSTGLNKNAAPQFYGAVNCTDSNLSGPVTVRDSSLNKVQFNADTPQMLDNQDLDAVDLNQTVERPVQTLVNNEPDFGF